MKGLIQVPTKRSSAVAVNLISVAASRYATLVLQPDGRMWGVGLALYGALGNNNTDGIVNSTPTGVWCSPVCVCGTIRTFCKVAAGETTIHAIDKNGRAWGWGSSTTGNLGNNVTTGSFATPVSICGAIKTFCKVINHGYALNVSGMVDQYGRAWSWGRAPQGALGTNQITVNEATPVSVCGAIKTFCQIATGGNSTTTGGQVALTKDGRAWGWGYYRNIGNNSTAGCFSTPVCVCGAIKTFCSIVATTGQTTLALDQYGRAWAWGNGASGRLGNNGTVDVNTPVSVCGAVRTFCHIAGSFYAMAGIDKYGQIWTWGVGGATGYGNLGNTDFAIVSTRTPISLRGAKKTFCRIVGGSSHFVAVTYNNQIWSWGDNTYGQLGNGNGYTQTGRPIPAFCNIVDKTFCFVSGYYQGFAAIQNTGKVWCWGLAGNGQTGSNTFDASVLTPVSIVGANKTFCAVAGASLTNIALDKYGRLWRWGFGGSGIAGDNSATQSLTPKCVCGAIKTFCKISGGQVHAAVLDQYGRAWSWGGNSSGQLGDNSTTNKCTPVSVRGAVKTFCEIASGNLHSIAIDKNGKLWAWGSTIAGQLGNNSTTASASTPIAVSGASKTFCKVAACINNSFAIDYTGKLWGWGAGAGYLPSAAVTTSYSTPIAVSYLSTKTMCHIACGCNQAIAIDKDGVAWTWGSLSPRFFINPTPTGSPRSIIAAIYGSSTPRVTFCRIAGVHSRTAALIDNYGKIWNMGGNISGQLGHRNLDYMMTPVRMIGY